ncbi:hypothetical protein AB6F64_08525 [Providencia hangzhouensis]|uniref:Uncharacterized protein n=3 Tax=Providencia TaxID=586 RepID=A0AAJ4NKH6_PRORE|nr:MULTISPECIES: hypothetical protein [Providencia]MBJ9971434.1 hypothetical protein [Providencia rettgeri]MCB6144227.1 hypothetical protein [Providencia rettgeri]MCF8964532.1 hypothetical protein [Providencia rettgeri]QWQ18352.1 hypothetical protein KOL65_07690 [Providencia rettgeri]QWQ22188.1 hypothetical protein KOF27_07695 [Providencia rettgeri]
MSSTFNKNRASLGSIKNQNIFKEIDYSATLSIRKKPSINVVYLEGVYEHISKNSEHNKKIFNNLLAKIDNLKDIFKMGKSDEWYKLQELELKLIEQADKQTKNFEVLQKLHSKHTKMENYYTLPITSSSIKLNTFDLIEQYKADLLNLLSNMREKFILPDNISYHKNPIIQNAIGTELDQFNSNLNDSYQLSQQYTQKMTENVQNRFLLMEKTFYAEGHMNDLYTDAKKSKSNIEQLLKELNSNSIMHSTSNHTVDKLIKCTTKLNTQYTEIQYSHDSFDKIKNFEYLDDIHNHFEQDKDFYLNYQESDYQNNKEFKLLTELNQSISNLKKIKINAQKTLDNHILPIDKLLELTPDRQQKYQKDIDNKLETLFNKLEARINVEIKKEAGLYYDQSTYLINRSQLEKDILSVKEDLANYIIENRTLAQEKKTHDSIEELTTQFHDEFLRTKTLQKFVSLELNSHLYPSSKPSKIGSYANNVGDKKDNIYMLAVEKKLLKNELNNLISNIHIKIPLKSTSSAVGEDAYYQTVKGKMYTLLDLTEQLGSLTKMYSSKEHSEILEYINDIHSLEKQIVQTEKEISQYIYTHSENKDKKSISSEITPLIIEIMNKKSKIMSIKTRINERADEFNFTDGNGNNKDFESLLSSIMAEFPQDTIISDVYDQPLHNKSMPVFIPLRD